MYDLLPLAQALVTTLSPHMASLLKGFTSAVGKKSADMLGERAMAVWNLVKQHFSQKDDLHNAATLVSQSPEDLQLQKILAQRLIPLLEKDPNLVNHLKQLFGGNEGLQRILAKNGSTIEKVEQQMRGGGIQQIESDNQSSIEGVVQRKG